MDKINFVNGTAPALNATNLNQLQTNVENAINTQIVATTGTNLDDYKTEGKYYFSSNHTPTNIPAGSNGFLEVLKGACIKQIWYRHGTANANDYQTYVRTFTSNAWSNWKQYQMVEDTGWIDLKLNTGITANDNTDKYKCKYRKVGKQVYVVGCVKGITEENTEIATLPEGFRPSYQYRYVTGRNVNSSSILQVSTGGVIYFVGLTQGTTINATSYVYIQTSFIVD